MISLIKISNKTNPKDFQKKLNSIHTFGQNHTAWPIPEFGGHSCPNPCPSLLKSPKRKTSIIKKSFYLAEIYMSRVLYFECMSTDSYESSGSVDYDGIKKSVISLQNRRGNCNCFQAFIFHLYSFFFSGAL